jgi:type VI protein secretion system component Hcp
MTEKKVSEKSPAVLEDKELETATGGSLNFTKIKFEYKAQQPEGTVD